jgi:uncharacterized membrane protein
LKKVRLQDQEFLMLFVCIYLLLLLTSIKHAYGITVVDNSISGTVLFGITSGILSLIGLVAIFVSLTSQLKIQKLRESYWGMISSSRQEYNPEKISRLMSNKIKEYGIIYKEEDTFMKTVVQICQKGILLVVFLWLIYASFIADLDFQGTVIISTFTIGGIYILLLFYGVLGHLNDISYISGLEKVEEILDVKGKSAVESIFLLPTNLKLQLVPSHTNPFTYQNGIAEANQKVVNDLKVIAHMDIPITNFCINLELINIEFKKYKDKLNKESIEKYVQRHHINRDIVKDKDFIDSVLNWQSNGQPYRVELFELIQGDTDKIIINEESIVLPKGTSRISFHFTITKTDSILLPKHVHKLPIDDLKELVIESQKNLESFHSSNEKSISIDFVLNNHASFGCIEGSVNEYKW